MSSARERAEKLLRAVGESQAELEAVEAEAEREISRVREHHKELVGAVKADLKVREKALLRYLKAAAAEVFDGEDTVKLESGVILHTQEPKVRIPRDALEKIKAQGWTEAIRVAESVDRGVVEEWPDERLAAIGAERKDQEVYGYELADAFYVK